MFFLLSETALRKQTCTNFRYTGTVFSPPCPPVSDPSMMLRLLLSLLLATIIARPACAEGEWEITRESEQSLERGLAWLAKNQGRDGNWSSNDLGLVSLGVLAFLASGHAPGRGRYGRVVQTALDYVVDNAKPTGLLNISNSQRDMYNHGLSTFVLGQAYGMTTTRDRRLHTTLDRALR